MEMIVSLNTGLPTSLTHILADRPLHSFDKTVWDEIIHPLWRARDFPVLVPFLRLLILSQPGRTDLHAALLHINVHQGIIDAFPAPRIALCLEPTNGKIIVYKRLYQALELFHAGDVEGSIMLFRRIARALPKELPFCFGANLRREEEIRGLLLADHRIEAEFSSFSAMVASKTESPTLLVSADRKYLERLGDQFLGAVEANAPGAHVHIHYCDFEGDWPAWLRALRGRWDKIALTGSRSRGGGMSRPTYFACARLMILPEILRRTQRPVLVVDLDAALLCDPVSVSAVLGGVDVGLCETEGTSFWNRVKANLIWVAPTPGGHRFARDVSRYITGVLSSPECAWTLDQTALWAIRRRADRDNPGTTFANLHAVDMGDGGRRDLFARTVDHRSVSRSIRRSVR